jgi:hypothetical protein
MSFFLIHGYFVIVHAPPFIRALGYCPARLTQIRAPDPEFIMSNGRFANEPILRLLGDAFFSWTGYKASGGGVICE